MISKFGIASVASTALAIAFFGVPAAVQAGTVILEGSDAIGLHCGSGNASACAYEKQVWTALDGGSGLPIAVIGNSLNAGIASEGSGVTIDTFASVAAAGTLSNYAALWFEAGGGCCSENDSLITAAGAQAAVTAYINGGGTVMINDYSGGAAWDFAVGTTGGAGGNAANVGCSDGEKVTAAGLANGFTQPGTLGCWEHQGYVESFFSGLTSINGSGFTLSFFDGVNPGQSGLLSNGVTLTGASTPEPASLLTMGVGLVGLGAMLRRRRAAKK